jgi:hypothetical protein
LAPAPTEAAPATPESLAASRRAAISASSDTKAVLERHIEWASAKSIEMKNQPREDGSVDEEDVFLRETGAAVQILIALGK